MTEPCVHGPHLLDGNHSCAGCGTRWTEQQVKVAINAPGGEYPGQPIDDWWLDEELAATEPPARH